METSIQEQTDTGIEGVSARLNYLAEAIPKPVNYAYDPPAGVPRSSGKHVAHNVVIRNGRELLSKLSLDTNGFVLTEYETAVKDFYDPDEVKSVYYPEAERLIKRETGAERVVIFDHVVRNPVLAERGEKGARSPARTVHNDYSFKSVPRRVRDLLPELADRLLEHRFAEINVWRAIRSPIESSPLALCDARSLSAEDIVPADLVYRDRVGETFGFLYNPNHRWYYFPWLERNEAILLKCYDSKDDGRARFTAHTSFDDPNSPPNAAPRESIEVRALVFWPAD
ncbi:MAG TPA: CmcJ/NvfI family oxidoreductase [Candidatus Binataceae bacterium]|nr:CmcJ/NvfI family oxidoreductase [Candidatus Binataceae bacterium]